MRVHWLKTVSPFFAALWSGEKPFEIRDNSDRGFATGDRLVLQEYIPEKDTDGENPFTDRIVVAEVGYMLSAEEFPLGLCPGYVALELVSPRTFEAMTHNADAWEAIYPSIQEARE
jgi:hypothetical protein